MSQEIWETFLAKGLQVGGRAQVWPGSPPLPGHESGKHPPSAECPALDWAQTLILLPPACKVTVKNSQVAKEQPACGRDVSSCTDCSDSGNVLTKVQVILIEGTNNLVPLYVRSGRKED